MTHPGVGPLTALAFKLVIGTPERFHYGKQITSYVGVVPSEESSGESGDGWDIRTQGNTLLPFLLVKAPKVTIRSQPQWRSKFFRLTCARGRKIATVAMARKLAAHLHWMWRQGGDYEEFEKLGSHAGSARKSPWCGISHRRNGSFAEAGDRPRHEECERIDRSKR
jgi:transposase